MLIPSSLHELSEVIGSEATIALITEYTGTRKYIPTTAMLTTEHDLVKVIGWDSAYRLCEYCGGDRLDFPKTCEAPLPEKMAIARRMRKCGFTNSDIAKFGNISTRTAINWCNDRYQFKPREKPRDNFTLSLKEFIRQNTNQLSLF